MTQIIDDLKILKTFFTFIDSILTWLPFGKIISYQKPTKKEELNMFDTLFDTLL